MDIKKEINSGIVLIVDDIPENLQVLGSILISKGLDVGFATSGAEALENVKYNPPDLILLDIMMPGMNGFVVCEKLKENPLTKHIPIIISTEKDLNDEDKRLRGGCSRLRYQAI